MSTFAVPVVRIRAIEPIPNADAIELAVVGEYRSVVRKGQFSPGDTAAYLPEAAIIPDDLLERLGLTGKLAGSLKNRVKAIKLRGCLSQGILYSDIPPDAAEGDDLAEALGIIKYEPPIPEHMGGDLAQLFGGPLKYDIENYKAHHNLIPDGEMVEFSEKVHGTFCGIAVQPGLKRPEMFQMDGFVYSKGLGSKGLVFKNNYDNFHNIYVATAREHEIHGRIRKRFPGQVVHVLGEVYGAGVQDLAYGGTRRFAVFDINVDGDFLSRDAVAVAASDMGLPRVPVLYRGPFSREVLMEHTDGKTVLGAGSHIREGVVVTPVIERYADHFGRVVLKSVSGDYLTRKGDATEFS